MITQGDIRQVQLAKGAIATGIRMLLKKVDKTPNDVEHVYLAGAFGNYINRKSAVTIGLLPEIPVSNVKAVGNAAGA